MKGEGRFGVVAKRFAPVLGIFLSLALGFCEPFGFENLGCWCQSPVGNVASVRLHKQNHTQGQWSQTPYEPPGAGTAARPSRAISN